MKSFVRVSEVWVPSADGQTLVLAGGSYGAHSAFRDLSAGMTFAKGEGLPGAAWANEKPVALRKLEGARFLRAAAAHAAGLSTGIALPFFVGGELASVVVLFCGDSTDLVGAIEVWEEAPDGSELRLTEGFYGAASSFEWVSRHATFKVGHGLPGIVWASGLAHILPDLGRTSCFLRANAALKVGIEHGVGIPCGSERSPSVVTLLSSRDTPIASRMEIWTPTLMGDALEYHAGFCDVEPEHGLLPCRPLARGEGLVGKVMTTHVATVLDDLESDPTPPMRRAHAAGLRSAIAMPVFVDGELSSVVVMYDGRTNAVALAAEAS